MNHKALIKELSIKYGVPEEVVSAVVETPYSFLRTSSKDFTGVRIPKFGVFSVKPNRKKIIDERSGKNKEGN